LLDDFAFNIGEAVAIAGGASMPWWIVAWLACTAASWGLSRRWQPPTR